MTGTTGIAGHSDQLDDVAVVQRGHPEIGIVVCDLDASDAFYRDAIGLTYVQDVVGPYGRQRRFTTGSAIVKLLAPNDPPASTNPPGGLAGAAGLRWITFAVADIDATVDRCVSLGAAVPSPISEWKPGHRAALVEDPDGVLIELVPRDEPWPTTVGQRL